MAQPRGETSNPVSSTKPPKVAEREGLFDRPLRRTLSPLRGRRRFAATFSEPIPKHVSGWASSRTRELSSTALSPPHTKKAPFRAFLCVAEREGFEPSMSVNPYTLSRRAPSATRPPLRMTSQNGWRPKPATPRHTSKLLPLLPSGPGGVDSSLLRGDR